LVKAQPKLLWGGIERRTDQIDTFQFSPTLLLVTAQKNSPTLLLVTAQKNVPEPEPMPGAFFPA
jgi:hypothetical protein